MMNLKNTFVDAVYIREVSSWVVTFPISQLQHYISWKQLLDRSAS